MIDEKTEKQMEKIRRLTDSLDPEEKTFTLAYNMLNVEGHIFLNKEEKKERKDTDWLAYFLRGYYMGIMKERNTTPLSVYTEE
jgi:hypothetical protein